MDITLKQAYEIFIQYKTAECEKKTIEYYQGCMRHFVTYIEKDKGKQIDKIFIDDITKADLMGFISHLRNKPKFENNLFVNPSRHDEKMSKTSVRSYQRGIKVFFTFCHNEELMTKDLHSNYKLIKKDTKEKIPLYSNEVESILNLYSDTTETGVRNKAIILLMLDCGLRSGEVISLKIKNIMFDKNLLLVTGKGNKERVVPMSRKVKKYLTKYLILYRKISIEQQEQHIDYYEDVVFISIQSREAITKNVITQMFGKIKKKANIERVHPHLLRHTFATSFMLCGGDVMTLRMLLGHEDIQTPMIYLHLANKYKMLNSDVYELDKVFFKRVI